jgi:hypothetical protein
MPGIPLLVDAQVYASVSPLGVGRGHGRYGNGTSEAVDKQAGFDWRASPVLPLSRLSAKNQFSAKISSVSAILTAFTAPAAQSRIRFKPA